MRQLAVCALLSLTSAVAFAEEPSAPPVGDIPVTDAPPAASSGMRVRWGVSGALGYLLPASAVDFGASGRIGVQLNENLGVFGDIGYVAGIGLGGSISGSSASVSVSAVSFWHLTPTVELDLGKFFLAAGPLIGNGGWGQISQSADENGNVSQYVVAASGFLLGMDVKTGLTFGAQQPSGKRSGFTLALDFKLLTVPVASVSQQAGSGGVSQSIRTGDRIIGMTPMLTLGYESK